MPVRRKATANKTYSYDTPDCFMQGCREVETMEFRVINLTGPAVEWFCENHARRIIWDEYMKHARETGRRQ